MKLKQKIITFGFALIALFGVMTVATPAALADCGGAKTSILNCSQGKGGKNAQDTGVWGLIIIVLNIMTAGVGVLAVGGVVYASILYASSSDNAEQTKQAKQIIKNVAIGILAYAGMYLILNFLIPGGIFS